MSVFNADVGKVSYSGSFVGPRVDAYTKAPPAPEVLAELDMAVSVQKRADNELARLLAAAHENISTWRAPSDQTSVGKWLNLFNQSWKSPALKAWTSAQNLNPNTLRLHGSTLTAEKTVDGKRTTLTFSPNDGSGWWPIGRQAIASAAILDPKQSGLAGNSQADLGPQSVAAFYGLSWPVNNAQAEHLKLRGFPTGHVADDLIRAAEVRELALQEFMDTEQEAELMKTLLGVIKDKPDDEKIDLGAILQAISPGSSFAIANKSRPQVLKSLRDNSQMLPILQASQADAAARLRLVDGQLYVKSSGQSGQWNNVTAAVRANGALAPLLENAIEQAKSTGNIINSGARADASQLLRFAGMDKLPANITVSELRNLLSWKLNPLPPGPHLGNGARDFLADARSPEFLSTEQRARVRASATGTNADAQPTLTLFDCSPQPWAGLTPELVRRSADKLIAKALSQGDVLARSGPILQALKDDPSAPAREVSPSARQQMILARDLLRVDPELGLKRNQIAGYDLYSASNSGKTLLQVHAELQIHIANTQNISPNEAVLITHILLATVAPEFLVKGADEERVGSLSLVNLRLQTALVELASPGSSRAMNTEQISSRALLTPVSTEHEQFLAAESAGPIYDWAIAQGVVTPEENYSPSAVHRAFTHYNRRLAELGAMSSEIDNANTVLITRSEAAKQELERVSPGNDEFFKKRTIYTEPDSVLYGLLKPFLEYSAAASGGSPSSIDGKRISIAEHAIEASFLYDLYMSGVLTAENANSSEWKFTSSEDRLKFESLKPLLSTLKPISEVFDRKFNAATAHLENAKALSTKIMMSEMPVEDRVRLNSGTVFVLGPLTPQLSQQEIGPIIYVTHASGPQCYQFLPSTNSYIVRLDLMDAMSSMAHRYDQQNSETMRLYKRKYPTLPADMGVQLYLPADTQDQNAAFKVPNTYSSMRTDSIVNFLKSAGMLVDRPLMLADAKGTTSNEKIQQKFDNAESFIVNTLIPFKGNIEDIASGDPKRIAMGSLGLGLELIGAVFVVVGAASAAAKGASILFKLGQFGKAALSMFNLPGAVVDTSKALFRLSQNGIKGLGNVAPKALSKGLSDLRSLVSAGYKKPPVHSGGINQTLDGRRDYRVVE
ncbi:hypothetical protein LRS56_12165 [Pseudomonas poae]|nr:hypothetical protein LRS56_12165 [Pseudomonas poae]